EQKSQNLQEHHQQQQSSKPTTIRATTISPTTVSITTSNEEGEHIVYIPVLPPDEPDSDLESRISNYLQNANDIKCKRIECITEIGIGVIYLEHSKDKIKLTEKVKLIVLPTTVSSSSATINFVKEIELISYRVVDGPKQEEQEKQDLPTVDEIWQRWSEISKSNRSSQCEMVSMQYPNIFKVKSYSVDDLLKTLHHGGLIINDLRVRICAHADCSYFETLPTKSIPPQFKKIDLLLFSFIITQLEMSEQEVQRQAEQCIQQAEQLYQQLISSNKANRTTIDVLSTETARFKKLFYIDFNKESSTVLVYENLVNQGCKPLLLNMANATSPGGGYRKGDGAQEENLSKPFLSCNDYYLSLDYAWDTTTSAITANQSARFKHSSNCYLDKMSEKQSMYPMDEFGCIYTSGITFFRDSEDKGYSYLSTPLNDVKAIAIAAYRDPPLQNNKRLEIKKACGTRKKIENLFAIAHIQGHDSLVLSAMGCGAFKNPPQHIALLFKSVIDQYAGFFKQIIFAIVDGHNTGKQINPDGNFLPFKDALDGLQFKKCTEPSVGMMIGPYRIVGKKMNNDNLMLSAFVIGDKSPCYHAANCKDINDQKHCRQFSHPPLCPYGTECHPLDYDDVHTQFFFHLHECSAGGECTETDQKHLQDYVHPDYCHEGGRCTNMKKNHLRAHRHLPLCPTGLMCKEYLRGVVEHRQKYRHCKLSCEYGNNFHNFHNPQHFQHEVHPFNQPCSLTPFSCKQFIKYRQEEARITDKDEKNRLEEHCLLSSHVCPWG
ncbi:unnamed protein product, partial [Didymodactylos carnosus]